MNKYKLNRNYIIHFDKKKVTIFNPENSQLYSLNITATEIVTGLEQGLTVSEITKKLLNEYDIDPLDANKEVLRTIDYLLDEKIIQ